MQSIKSILRTITLKFPHVEINFLACKEFSTPFAAHSYGKPWFTVKLEYYNSITCFLHGHRNFTVISELIAFQAHELTQHVYHIELPVHDVPIMSFGFAVIALFIIACSLYFIASKFNCTQRLAEVNANISLPMYEHSHRPIFQTRWD